MAPAPSSQVDLTGQTAVVTGAAGGMGVAICETLSAEGANIVAADIDTDGLAPVVAAVEANGRACDPVHCDVTDPDSVRELLETVVANHGSVEILVSGHGAITRSHVTEITPEEWERDVDVNLKGTFNVVQPFFDHMLDNGYGKIVCIGSVVGEIGGGGRKPGYAAAKGGIHAFAKGVAAAGAEHGVYCNVLAPALVRTPMTEGDREYPDDYAPLGRVGEAGDVAQALLFLVSQQSNWMTGRVITLDGGRYGLWRP